jgi:hypothetical protein
MRKSKFTPGLRFRWLLMIAGALLPLVTLVPAASADLIAYFNFEDSFNGGPLDFTSDVTGAPDFILAAAWCLQRSRPIIQAATCWPITPALA